MIVRTVSKIMITLPIEDTVSLIDFDSKIQITPLEKIINGNFKTILYGNLWLGKFTLVYGELEEKIVIDTGITSTSSLQNIQIVVTKYKRRRIIKSTLFRNIRKQYIARMFAWGWDYTLKNADKLLCVCKYLCDEAAINIEKEGEICPIGIEAIDIDSIDKLRLKHPCAVLIQNHQIKDKSKALIDFAEIIQTLPKVTFYVSRGLPENSDNPNTRNVYHALEKLDNVNFVDICASNKYSYLVSSDLYILRSGLDCTPATVLEAGIAGKPILASKVGGVPEMIVDGVTGWSIDNNDIDLWREKILTLTRDIKLANSIGRSNREHVIKNYEMSVIAKKIYDLF